MKLMQKDENAWGIPVSVGDLDEVQDHNGDIAPKVRKLFPVPCCIKSTFVPEVYVCLKRV